MAMEAKISEETQRLKRIAASSYDYDNDSRWTDFWSSVLIPPHLASRPDVILHFKLIFYHRLIDHELVVDTTMPSSSSSSEITSEIAGPSTPPPPASDQPQAQSSGTTTGNSGTTATAGSTTAAAGSTTAAGGSTPATAGPTSAAMRMDRHTLDFSVNAWVLIAALLAMVLFKPRNLSYRVYRLSLMGTTFSTLISMSTLAGPRAWELNDLQVYIQSVIATKDFIYFIYCLTFLTSDLYLKLALIPLICRSLEHVAKFLRRNFTRYSFFRKCLEKPCAFVESNTTTLSRFSAKIEIGLGFLLIIPLFTWQGNLIQTFMYWQLLKLMYHFPTTSGYHQSGWAKIGRIVNPYLNSCCFSWLKSPLSTVQRWWFR